MNTRVAENVKMIRSRIAAAASRVNRDPAEIGLIAVTKYVESDLMNDALQCGITDIAENRVQEGLRKFPQLEHNARKHLIGTLQTNKVKAALRNFDLIHSVDRVELIEALAKQAEADGREVPFLLQVNISGELTKHGFQPAEIQAVLEGLQKFPLLVPSGLMTMAPFTDNPETARPIFRALRELFQQCRKNPGVTEKWKYLSMGMSGDFEVAVEEGANLLRIGTAIFTLL